MCARGLLVSARFLSLCSLLFFPSPTLSQPIKPYQWRKAFRWWLLGLAAVVIFIGMHVANYPGQPDYSLYGSLLAGVNVPWFCRCLRRAVVVPGNAPARAYVIAYDVFITKP